MRSFVFVGCLLFGSAAWAQDDAKFCNLGVAGVVAKAKPLNGTVNFKFGPRACGRSTSSYGYLVVEMDYTHDNNGNVVLTCTTGQSVSTADKVPQVCGSVTDGVCILDDAGIAQKAVTGDKKWTFRFGIRGYRAWSCTTTHSGTPSASDIVTENAYLTD